MDVTSIAGTGFEDVDRTSDPLARVSHLDAVAALRETVAYKRQTFELMHLQAGDAVLDVGGAGDDLRSLAELVGPFGHVVGIDPSETMLLWREHKRPDWRSNAWSATPTELDFPSEMFAAVRADRVFQHLERPRQALAELTRVTRRDGRGRWPWIRIGTQC